jgi:hypothetical protein
MNRAPHSGQESVSVATSNLGIAISLLEVGTLVAQHIASLCELLLTAF